MQDKTSNSRFGIDINEYTKDVQFNILATRIDFLYLRSSGSGSGRFRVDKKFLDFARLSREYGIPVGAYHFGVPSYDLTTADSQCDDFITVLQRGFGENDYGDLFPVIDVEVPIEKSISTKALINWIDRFRKRFEQKTGRRLMLYTGLFFIQTYNNFYVEGVGYPLKNMPLWIAMYTKVTVNPLVPPDIGGWKRWRIWQYSEDAIVRGVGNPVDANWGPNNVDSLTEPNAVRGLRAQLADGNIYVTWSRNTDADIVGYNIFLNKEWVGTVGAEDTEFTIKKGSFYYNKDNPLEVSIEAFDYDGETSTRRAAVKI